MNAIADPRKYQQGRQCEHVGCFSYTQAAKPYCSTHITENPAAARVRALLKARQRDITNATLGRFDPLGPLASELIELTTHQPVGIGVLVHKLGASLAVVRWLASKLEGIGVLVVDRGRGGVITFAMVKVGTRLPLKLEDEDADKRTGPTLLGRAGPEHHHHSKE